MSKFLRVKKDFFAFDDNKPEYEYRYGTELIRINDIIHVFEHKSFDNEYILTIEYMGVKGQSQLQESFETRGQLASRIYEIEKLLNDKQ